MSALAITFQVPGDPVPWARARLGKTGLHFTPEKQRSYMTMVRDYGATAMGGLPLIEGPVELSIIATFLRPKSAPKRNPPRWKPTRPDASNYLKLCEDALNRVVWKDDAQVARLSVVKQFGDAPSLAVTVRALGDA